MKKADFALIAAALSFSIAGNVGAQTVLANRTDLNAALGPSAVTETFEGYPVQYGGAEVVGITDLNSTTGPVIPGFSLIASGGGELQWNGNGYFGLPTETVLMNAENGSETIQFTSPVSAFGVDLLAYAGYGATATATVYAANDSTVLTTVSGLSLGGGADSAFLGVADSSGIGEVVLSQNNWSWAPIIDNLEFGTATASAPETGSTALLLGILACGLVAYRHRRMSFQA